LCNATTTSKLKKLPLTTKVSFSPAQKETAVALPAPPPAGEMLVIKAFFWLWGKQPGMDPWDWKKSTANISVLIS